MGKCTRVLSSSECLINELNLRPKVHRRYSTDVCHITFPPQRVVCRLSSYSLILSPAFVLSLKSTTTMMRTASNTRTTTNRQAKIKTQVWAHRDLSFFSFFIFTAHTPTCGFQLKHTTPQINIQFSTFQTFGGTVGDHTSRAEPHHLVGCASMLNLLPLAIGESYFREVIVQRLAVCHPNVPHELGSWSPPVGSQQTTMCISSGCTNLRRFLTRSKRVRLGLLHFV